MTTAVIGSGRIAGAQPDNDDASVIATREPPREFPTLERSTRDIRLKSDPRRVEEPRL